MDDAMFYGRDGELPTASAIVGDVFDIVRNILFGCTGRSAAPAIKRFPLKNRKKQKAGFS